MSTRARHGATNPHRLAQALKRFLLMSWNGEKFLTVVSNP